MRNPFRAIRGWFKVRAQKVVDQLPPLVVKKVVEPVAKVIGIPSSWFTFGYPSQTDWLRIEETYRDYPMVSYAVEQFSEQAVGPGFYLKPAAGPGIDEDEALNAKAICDQFDDRQHSKQRMGQIFRELYLYGNSAMERRFTNITKDPDDPYKVTDIGDFATIQPLPLSTMRVVPHMFTGVDPPRGYVEIIMGQYIKLAPEQIAWFRVSVTSGNIGDEFYGQGCVQPSYDYVLALERMERDMVIIIHRYAAPKGLWQLGSEKDIVPDEKLADWSQTIAKVQVDEDYVGTHLTDFKFLVPSLNMRYTEVLTHFRSMVVAGLQNPNLMLVMLPTRVSDASAQAMQEAWNRKISAAQDVVKEVWEDLIYKPLIVQAGYGPEYVPELVFGTPAVPDPEQEKKDLISMLNPSTVQITQQTRLEIENLLRQEYGLEPLDIQGILDQQQQEAALAQVQQQKQQALDQKKSDLMDASLQEIKGRINKLEKPPGETAGIGRWDTSGDDTVESDDKSTALEERIAKLEKRK